MLYKYCASAFFYNLGESKDFNPIFENKDFPAHVIPIVRMRFMLPRGIPGILTDKFIIYSGIYNRINMYKETGLQ